MVLQEYDNRASNPTGEGVPWQIDRGTNRKDTPMCIHKAWTLAAMVVFSCVWCAHEWETVCVCVCKMLHFDMALAGGWDNVRDPAVCGYYARDGVGWGMLSRKMCGPIESLMTLIFMSKALQSDPENSLGT